MRIAARFTILCVFLMGCLAQGAMAQCTPTEDGLNVQFSANERAFLQSARNSQWVRALVLGRVLECADENDLKDRIDAFLKGGDADAPTVTQVLTASKESLQKTVQSTLEEGGQEPEAAGLQAEKIVEQALATEDPASLSTFEGRIVQGLSDFVAERAEEEVTLAVFNRLRTWFGLNKDADKRDTTQEALAALFPNLKTFLSSTEYTTFDVLASTWHTTLRADIVELPDRIGEKDVCEKVLGAAGVKEGKQDECEALSTAVAFVVAALRDLDAGKHPYEVLATLPSTAQSLRGNDAVPTGLVDAAAMTGTLARDLVIQGAPEKLSEAGQAYTLSFAGYLRASADQQRLYARLLVQSIEQSIEDATLKDAVISNTTKKAKGASSVHGTVDAWLQTTLQTMGALRGAQEAIADTSNSQAAVSSLATAFVRVLEASHHLPGAEDEDLDASIRSVNAIAALYGAIQEERYPDAVTQATKLYQQVAPEKPLPKHVGSLAMLAATTASAESAEDVTEALHAVAAPVGSYRVKRISGSTRFTVTSYVGAVAGYEPRLYGGGVNLSDEGGYVGGLAAPIGVELSQGFGGASLGLFVSVLDVGALVSQRFDNLVAEVEGSAEEADIQGATEPRFVQVFAPGAFLTLGVSKNWPLSFGLGGQWIPDQRTIEINGTEQRASALRWSAFLAVDLTLFAF